MNYFSKTKCHKALKDVVGFDLFKGTFILILFRPVLKLKPHCQHWAILLCLLPSSVVSGYKPQFVCYSAHRRGNCKKASVGLQCEVGLRCRTYYVLCGSVLSVWNEVELVLTPVGGTNVKVQIVRLRTEDGQRIVGKLKNFKGIVGHIWKYAYSPRVGWEDSYL